MKNNSNAHLKQSLKQLKDKLCEEFRQHMPITVITHQLITLIDELLLTLFQKNKLHVDNAFCLLALGSYGRRELQLYSDVDLLLLHHEQVPKLQLVQAQTFIQDCWDIGLEVSHQITTVDACAELAQRDLSVISSILDMHLICGRNNLMEELRYKTHPLHMWPSHHYFYAKKEEQYKRYMKYGESAYNLEPNVKYGAGGLRDLQVILSLAKRHFQIKKLADGIQTGFITDKEYEELLHCQHFLWRVRFALHLLAEKQEERLIFDHQVKLASLFGFMDDEQSLAIEQFMKAYFKVIKRSRELNEILLQWFAEVIVAENKKIIIPLDKSFQLFNNYIEVKHPKVFLQNPVALLKLFLWIAKHPTIEGVRASTVRFIRQSLYLMNRHFRASKAATDCFVALFHTHTDPYKALQLMNRYGVLGHYLDCFSAIIGQMQYDLFHIYTVDQHTLFVIRNLARFLDPNSSKPFPLASKLMPTVEKRAILYLAALFHDIAKGRGGNHSELGAIEAEQFAQRHGLKSEERELLVWLVRHHLLMSQTAQRQDIYDPKTIEQFCSLLPQASYLDYLYLLTVADICATNHKLWNAWKDSLLKELYHAAYHAMQQEKTLLDERSLITKRQQQALVLLKNAGASASEVESLWAHFKGTYFLHESPEAIARQTQAIMNCQQYPLVLIMPHHSQGGTEVFIYMPHRDERFTIATTILSNHHTTIQEAVISTCNNHYDLDTYIILDQHHQGILDERSALQVQRALVKHLLDKTQLPTISRRRLSRTQAHFNLKPQITFTDDPSRNRTCLFLVTADRPGLLASISQLFLRQNIQLHNAKIATAGERVEDMFFLSTQEGCLLSQEDKKRLTDLLIGELQG